LTLVQPQKANNCLATGQLDEALRAAEEILGAKFGCVEPRPIVDDPQTMALRF